MICSLVGKFGHYGRVEMASIVAWSSWVQPKVCVVFISFLDSPGCLERISTGVTLTFSMEWLYLMKWSYKKLLYSRLELFLILNEWLLKRPVRVWDVSLTYWAPQPLVFHVITYNRFELFWRLKPCIGKTRHRRSITIYHNVQWINVYDVCV